MNTIRTMTLTKPEPAVAPVHAPANAARPVCRAVRRDRRHRDKPGALGSAVARRSRTPVAAPDLMQTASGTQFRAGLSTQDADRLRARHGPNRLASHDRPSVWLSLLRQVSHLFALLLWVAALLAALAGMPQLAVAIAIVVVFNGACAFAQEYRADRAVERLRDLLALTAVERRGGHRLSVDAADLVPGDVVNLRGG